MNYHRGSFLDEGFDRKIEEWDINKFDIIVGNPPYQEKLETKKGSAKPIYNRFTEKSLKITDKLLFIIPSRWFAGGKGLSKFRKMMLDRKDIKIIRHFQNDERVFGNFVDITGGVSYFLIDNKYNGECNFNGKNIFLNKRDILIKDSKFLSILDKIEEKELNHLGSICVGQQWAGINSNDKRLSNKKISNDNIKCYVSQQKGFEKWIDKRLLKTNIVNLDGYKVITAEANGEYPRFGNKFIGHPNEVCTQSYIVFNINNKNEAENLISYMNTKFVNKLLSLRKISQHIKPDTCKFIPLVDLSKSWTDEELYKYFNLTDEEIKLIEDTQKKERKYF